METLNSWLTSTPIANRGIFNAEEPENSLLAINKAVSLGYGVCLDVRALSDNTIVVFHDETLGRMTSADGFISNCTFEDIKSLTLNKTNLHIITLQEALDAIAGKVPVIICIKNLGKVSYEKYIWKILQSYKGECAVASINPYSLEWFKLNAPQIKRGQISSYFKGVDLPFGVRYAYKRMKLNKTISEPNFIIYKAEDLPNRYVSKYKDLPLLAYHVTSQESYNKVKKHCDNVIFEGFTI